MANYKAPRVDITVAGITLVGYRLQDNTWVMSLSSLARVLGLQTNSAFDFLHSKWLKSKLGKEFPPSTFSVSTEDNTQPIVAISTELAAKYFQFKYVKAANPVAEKLVDALMNQALDLRFEGTLTPDAPYHIVERVIGVKEGRKETRSTHNGFRKWYTLGGYPGSTSHDYLTKQLANLTAKEAREGYPTYAGCDPRVGLDHYQEKQNREMVNIGRVKYTLANQCYRQQAIDRAIRETDLV